MVPTTSISQAIRAYSVNKQRAASTQLTANCSIMTSAGATTTTEQPERSHQNDRNKRIKQKSGFQTTTAKHPAIPASKTTRQAQHGAASRVHKPQRSLHSTTPQARSPNHAQVQASDPAAADRNRII